VAVEWLVFDLNGTLLDLSCLAPELGGAGDGALVERAFDDAIGHAMADTLSGAYRPLPDYLRDALVRRLEADGRATDRVEAVMRRAKAMDPFGDARAAIDRAITTGLRLAVLSNSGTGAARGALEHAGLADALAAIMGSDAVGVFKPHPGIYRHALRELDVRPQAACMVAAHAWDIAGAARVGMRTAWISRAGRRFPDVFPAPDVQADHLLAAVTAVGQRLAR
jgi:2-haloacid dehalogenase